MDIIFGIVCSFGMLILGVILNVFVLYPLLVSLVIFMLIAYKRGFSVRNIIKMAYDGGKKAFVVLQIFIIIGAIIAVWISSGTVPGIVYYGVKLMNPHLFIFSAFIVNCFVSMLTGTSFGTIGTSGIAFMIMGRTGGVNENILAGAIIAGAYFGDRCSPMSSSANLVASLTETELYRNVKNMFKTALGPLIITSVIYLGLSFLYPMEKTQSSISEYILKSYNINFWVMLPAILILVFAVFKVNVKLSMLISIVTALIISLIVQHYSLINITKFILTGYTMDSGNPLSQIMKGGGIVSMLKVGLVVFVSSAFAGIFEGTEMLKSLLNVIDKAKSSRQIFVATCITALLTSAFGCTQALAIILTFQLNKKLYKERHVDNYRFAVDIENTAVVLAPLIPWNIAGLVPATSLKVGVGFIPFAVFLYVIPIYNILRYKVNTNPKL